MFGKVQSTRSAPAAAPQFEPRLGSQSASKKPRTFIKKLLRVKRLFQPSSSAQKDANSKGSSHRQQRALAPSQPPQVCSAASTFAPANFSFQGQTQTSAPLSITLLDAYVYSFCPYSISTCRDNRDANSRTNTPVIPSFKLLAKKSFQLLYHLTTRSEPTGSSNSPELLALPERVATSPTTEPPTFTSSGGSKRSSDISPTKQLIAELQATAAYLDGQYNQYIRGVHLRIQNQLFPFTQSLADEADSAKKELKQLLEQIASVDKDCSRFTALYQDKCDKLEEAELALEKAQRVVEKTEKEHAALKGEVRKIQWGAMMNGAWVKRDPQALQQDATPPRPAAEEGRGECPAVLSSPQQVNKAIKSWDSQWEPIIALGRYSFTSQESVVSTDSGRQGDEGRVRDADQATTSDDYNGRPLLSGQLDTYSLPLASEASVHSYEHA
ncbi:hypothetical protein FRC01_011642 [Tulasnella sp. 417]|nr:hypothetical protein FRC01_011642 [Tulasnella sp. 417]